MWMLVSDSFANASSASSVRHVLLDAQVLTHLCPIEGGRGRGGKNISNCKLHFFCKVATFSFGSIYL